MNSYTSVNAESKFKAALPEFKQIAYVVDDLHAAIKLWSEMYGIGPFIVREHIAYSKLEFEGRESVVDYSLAQAWHGDVQIELLQQHNDAPSVLSRHKVPNGTVHHFGVLADDFAADEAELLAKGFKLVQKIEMPNGTIVGFYSGEKNIGMIELIWLADGGAGWAKLKEAADTWDRRSPYANF